MGFLDIDNATKSYGNVEVLHKVDISVAEGEFLVLVGPSGCGKSTLLNMIAGLEEISSGEIRIKDQVMNGVHPSKRNIAMVFQSYALYPNMTVGQNITFGLEMHGVPKPKRDAAMADVARLLQIEKLLDRKPGQLSGGQRQRVAMGRALVRDPDVFLFDEPLSNLDAKLRVDMRTEIKKLHQNLGTTIVYVTHDQIEAMTLSTRIAVMNGGYVQQLGTPKEIYDTPANLFVATFMGSPSMNLLDVTLEQDGNALYAVTADSTGAPLRLRVAEPSAALSGYSGKRVTLGIRSEALTDAEGADTRSAHVESFPNAVSVVEPAGSDTFVTTQIGGAECFARMRADTPVSPGQPAQFVANMEKAVFFDQSSEQRIA
ncbi:MAG: sn-glycerol-3-phosphate ABC transporter ATP-binding protein UgpC [Pseudomonadota bacterium]